MDPRGLVADPDDRSGLDAMRDLGRLTGGRAVINTNDVESELDAVARENPRLLPVELRR
ncbi:MAG: hypothetical protein R2712_26535 [Vicinamibacterales bacterium]